MTDEELLRIAQYEPDRLTADDYERLGRLMRDATQSIADAFTPYVKVMVEALQGLADTLAPWVGFMPGPEFRRARKDRQLAEHRARVAARVPAWKR